MRSQLDFYGDGGALLRKTVPYGELPDFVKTAEYVGGRELALEDYALVLLEDGRPTPLFPTIDPGNVAISAHYLLHNQGQLPEDAVKVAAANLGVACLGFGLEVPEGLLTLAEPEVKDPVVEVGERAEERKKIAALHQEPKEPTGREKLAAKLGLQTTEAGKVKAQMANGMSLSAGRSPVAPFANVPKAPTKAPKIAAYDHVEKAAQHFNENWKRIHPLERVKMAQALLPICRDLGIELIEEARVYGAGVASPGRTKVALRARQVLSSDPLYQDLEKSAGAFTPEEMIQTLFELDAETGLSRWWGSKIDDPFLSVLEPPRFEEPQVKVASMKIAASEIRALAATKGAALTEKFGSVFTAQLQRSPVEVFESLPEPTQEALIQIARS